VEEIGVRKVGKIGGGKKGREDRGEESSGGGEEHMKAYAQ